MDAELLTSQEKHVLDLLKRAYAEYQTLEFENEQCAIDDMREFALHIHNAENSIMARAASRRYQYLYRL